MRLEIDATMERGAFTLTAQAVLERGATGVFGPSGAGKSTLLGAIAGLVRPARGRIVLDGEVLDDVAAGIHVPPHRRRLGMVFQAGHLLPHLDVTGNLRYGERLLPSARRRIRFADVVEVLDLADLVERRPRTLSGGERQRVALGRALLCSPRLLLLDEPLAALDAGLKAQILPYLRRARDAFAMPVLHVSHDLAELLHLCDDLLLVAPGRVAAHGRLAELAREPALLPQLHAAGMVNVLRGAVAAHPDADDLTPVDLDGGARVLCVRSPLPAGARIELLLRPEDIALALAPVAGISLRNQLPGSIQALTTAADRVVVQVDIGQPLLVEVSRRTVAQLGLAIGMPVTVLCKAMSLTGR
jgi:molybdate transport system ATP-binding protein